jgi:hypothetical protein
MDIQAKLAKFQELSAQLQLDSVLYALQGSALTCMVHVMLGDKYYDDDTILAGIKELNHHGILNNSVLSCALDWAEENIHLYN